MSFFTKKRARAAAAATAANTAPVSSVEDLPGLPRLAVNDEATEARTEDDDVRETAHAKALELLASRDALSDPNLKYRHSTIPALTADAVAEALGFYDLRTTVPAGAPALFNGSAAGVWVQAEDGAQHDAQQAAQQGSLVGTLVMDAEALHLPVVHPVTFYAALVAELGIDPLAATTDVAKVTDTATDDAGVVAPVEGDAIIAEVAEPVTLDNEAPAADEAVAVDVIVVEDEAIAAEEATDETEVVEVVVAAEDDSIIVVEPVDATDEVGDIALVVVEPVAGTDEVEVVEVVVVTEEVTEVAVPTDEPTDVPAGEQPAEATVGAESDDEDEDVAPVWHETEIEPPSEAEVEAYETLVNDLRAFSIDLPATPPMPPMQGEQPTRQG